MLRKFASWFGRVATAGAVFLVMAYQAMVRPFLVGTCKYHPSCSQYAIRAILGHGVVRGVWLSFRRICRCHPFAAGGWDPVPNSPSRPAGSDA